MDKRLSREMCKQVQRKPCIFEKDGHNRCVLTGSVSASRLYDRQLRSVILCTKCPLL